MLNLLFGCTISSSKKGHSTLVSNATLSSRIGNISTTRNVTIFLPLLIAAVFSFSYVYYKQQAAQNPSTVTSSSNVEQQTKLASVKSTAKPVSTLSVSSASDGSTITSTTSSDIQPGAVSGSTPTTSSIQKPDTSDSNQDGTTPTALQSTLNVNSTAFENSLIGEEFFDQQ